MAAEPSPELPPATAPVVKAATAPAAHPAVVGATGPENRWRATVHRDYAALEPVWREIETTGHCTVFQGYDYVASLYEAVSSTGAAEPLVVVVSGQNGAAAWIFPLCISRQGKSRVISFADLGVADYTAPLIARDAPSDRASVTAMLKAVFAALPPCDVISFQKITADVNGIRNPLLFLRGLEEFPENGHGIHLAEPWPQLARKIVQSTMRHTIKRERKRLEKAGEVAIEHCDTPETIEPALQALMTMRRERFQARGLAAPPVLWENFYRNLTAKKDRKIHASLTTLTVGGEAIAMCFGLTRGRTYYALMTSFKAGKWEPYRPGLQLFDVMLTKFAEQTANDGYFDFTIGDEAYKKRMGADTRILYDWMAPRSLTGVPYYVAWWAKARCRRYPRVFAMLQNARQRLRPAAKV